MPCKLPESMRGENFVLNYVANQQGDILPGKICGMMNVSSARIAQMLNNLEKKGFISRRIAPDDRRKILVAITPAGRDEAARHKAVMLTAIARQLDALGEHDAQEFVRIIKKMTEGYLC